MTARGPRDSELIRHAELALASVDREYPNHVVHLLRNDEDARPPRELTPAFFGSFDWHSAVHSHWSLARVSRVLAARDRVATDDPVAVNPEPNPFIARCRAALDRSLASDRMSGELEYLGAPERRGFERPYGLAWLLQLGAELREWSRSDFVPAHADARRWLTALDPLEALAVRRLAEWLPRLTCPIRSGEHSQTAFAMGLGLDWARSAPDPSMAELLRSRARDWYGADVAAPVAYEPSGHDFLSPVLGEADLMRRVLPSDEFASWLERFLPPLDGAVARRWLTPVASSDRADGKLAHLDGLNLSRAWMLKGIASGLPDDDPRRGALEQACSSHARAGLAAVSDEHYAGAHWLGSFAVYLNTGRGTTSEPDEPLGVTLA